MSFVEEKRKKQKTRTEEEEENEYKKEMGLRAWKHLKNKNFSIQLRRNTRKKNLRDVQKKLALTKQHIMDELSNGIQSEARKQDLRNSLKFVNFFLRDYDERDYLEEPDYFLFQQKFDIYNPFHGNQSIPEFDEQDIENISLRNAMDSYLF